MIADDKAFRDLEFARIKSVVRSYASSSLGEEAVDALAPTDDREALDRGFAEVGEAMGFLEASDRFSLGAVRDLAPLFRRAKDAAFLDGEEFLTVIGTIDGTAQVRDLLTSQTNRPLLARYAERLTGGGESIARGIHRVIDEHGTIRDDASPELARLTKRRRIVEDRLSSKLRAVMDQNPDVVSESVITRRRGRLVIPIRSGAVGQMDFVVHDRSATGQTLYAEPTGLVGENNELAGMADAIRDEIRRILRELTQAFLAVEPLFMRDRAVLAHLDSLFARAGYASVQRCAFPQLTDRIVLRNARHPLLPIDRAVPVSISLGERAQLVVVTGPNTGGKTVLLKTVGALTLMMQSCIPVPASPDSEMRVVKRVRTDIGDEQSIEQSLSTFSAHMKNIVSLLAEADEDSLILLDELGAGTDPQEGAALALSIIEWLLERRPLAAVSTHLTPVKYFAIRHPGILTASMAFDVESLEPTYHVIEGVPGRSNAFVIARRLGMSEELVSRAEGFLSHGEIRAEDIIEELHRERQTLVQQREAAQRHAGEARRLQAEYENRLERFEQEKEDALSERFRALDEFLRTGQRTIETALARANASESGETLRQDLKAVVDLRESLKEERSRGERAEPTFDARALQVGQRVFVRSVAADGNILHVDPKGGVTVDLDGIRVSTTVEDLEAAKRRAPRDDRPAKRPRVTTPRPHQVPLQLDVRGATVAEALRAVEDYLDQLLRADIRTGSVLHGKGTGALREAIHAYLGSCSFVSSVRFAPPNQGGDGVTEVDLGAE